MSNKQINLKYEISNVDTTDQASKDSFLIVVDTDRSKTSEFKMPKSLAGQYTKINAGDTVKKKEE